MPRRPRPARVHTTTATYRPGTPGRPAAPRSPNSLTVTKSDSDDRTVAKLFANGRSQAVRLPKEFRFAGDAVRISRDGNRVILEPLDDLPCNANGWPLGLWASLDELGETAGDFPDIQPLPVHLLTPAEMGPLEKPTR
jgi:antitoxin VapB